MTLFRGQAYGAPVGEWWTTSEREAEKFGMAAGGNRTWVVLGLDEDLGQDWIRRLLWAEREASAERGSWYRIPFVELVKHWRGVRVVGGAVSIEVPSSTLEERIFTIVHDAALGEFSAWERRTMSASLDAIARRSARQLMKAIALGDLHRATRPATSTPGDADEE